MSTPTAVLSDLADAEIPPDVHEPVQHEDVAETPVAQHTDVYAADAVVEEDHPRLESQPAILLDDDILQLPLDRGNEPTLCPDWGNGRL